MKQPATPSKPHITVVPSGDEASQYPRVPGYRFEKRVGQGGMATVWLATQESLDRPVSIKVMDREALADETSKQRFEHEARTIAKLTHPSIVSIYEVGRTADGRMYYIMPYLANGDLSQRDLRNDEGRILDVLRAMLSALDYAHARGVVHRDVKEENVLFDIADRPMLTDFGIALSKRDTSRITSAGLAVGSSGYMAPEQARGDEVDGRADLYSVGVLAYELLTGKLPYQSPDALALALMHAQKPIPRLPPEKRHWQSFIDRAMAKTPDHRFPDAQQMLHALERIGRRTTNDFSARALRGIDYAVDEKIWQRPSFLALSGVLLLVVGLYSVRDRLPAFGGSHAATPVATDAAPATAATPAAPARPLAPGTVEPSGIIAGSSAITTTPAPVAPPPLASPAPPPPAPVPAAAIATDPVPPPATMPGATTVLAPLTPDDATIAAARDALAHANLTSPADRNAIDLTKMAWKLTPATPQARQLATDVLGALGKQQALAIAQHRDARALDYQLKAQQFADATVGRAVPAWKSLHTVAATAYGKRVQAESEAADTAALARSEALGKQLGLADSYAPAVAAGHERALQKASANAVATASIASELGPSYVLLHPAAGARPAVALAKSQVTRHEYAQFVNATRRRAAPCSDANGAAAPAPAGATAAAANAAPRKNWTQPGFAQGSDQPVVCVSWNDANAYAQWLSAHDGKHYRVASASDWHEASALPSGVGAKFAEWLQDCSKGCASHRVGGPRGGGAERAGDHGFDDVGFRVVREIGGRD